MITETDAAAAIREATVGEFIEELGGASREPNAAAEQNTEVGRAQITDRRMDALLNGRITLSLAVSTGPCWALHHALSLSQSC